MAKILREADYASLTTKDSEIEKKLNELTENKDKAYVKKLMAFGEPLKKVCVAFGYDIHPGNGGNPLLAFVLQDYIKPLVNNGALNVNTFKAFYNAVAKHLVADSEFFTVNSYNIIYCRDLYNKSPKEIQDYLILQSKILKPDAKQYTAENQISNRKVFLHIDGITRSNGEEELNIVKRAKSINASENKNKIIKDVRTAKLNTIELAEQIYSNNDDIQPVSHITETELDKIVVELTDPALKFAAILSLSTSTKSKKAKKALLSNNPKFTALRQDQILKAFLTLSNAGILPKRQLREVEADLLVDKILATLAAEDNKQ